MQTSAVVRLVGSVLSIALVACGSEPAPNRPNLLLLTVDTLRADHLSGYGYARPTSPALDRFFESAVVFDDAYANSSWTLPSLASLLTSLLPSAHGCINHKSRLGSSFRTLAEILRDAGYATHGIASHTFLGRAYGLQQGFETFDDELALNLRMSHLATSSPQVTQKAVHWLDERARTGGPRHPWFLWAHYFDPHYVYIERPAAAAQLGIEGEQPVDLYDEEIAFTDHQIGIVFARLEQLGLSDSTVVVFTSDHGEAFGEHGHDQHGSNLFREVTQVPLAIRAPGFAPRHVASPAQGVDLLPTVLDLLGVEIDDDPDGPIRAGRSLVGAMRGEATEPEPMLLETELGRAFHAQALIDGRWKLIADRTGGIVRSATGAPTLRPRGSEPAEPTLWLFDRELDPNDRVDVSHDYPDVVLRMRAELDALSLRARARDGRNAPADSERAELSPEELSALQELGYLDASEPARHGPEPAGSPANPSR